LGIGRLSELDSDTSQSVLDRLARDLLVDLSGDLLVAIRPLSPAPLAVSRIAFALRPRAFAVKAG